MDFLIAAHTDVGIRKKTNQDSVLIKVADTDCGKVCFAAVCDGMGGLRKGELASATLIRDFSDWFDSEFPEILYEGLDTIVLRKSWERVVSICAKELERYSSDNQVRMGTTAAVLLLAQHRYFILNIGDMADDKGPDLYPERDGYGKNDSGRSKKGFKTKCASTMRGSF